MIIKKPYIIPLLMILSWSSCYAQSNRWNIFLPTEGIDVQGTYADNNQAIMINSNTKESFDFNDYLPFEIPDQTAVSAFSLEPSGDDFVLWLTFSTPVVDYLPGDIISCHNMVCQHAFSTSMELSVSNAISIDALDVNNGEISVSFNTGFKNNSEYISPHNIYSIVTISGNTVLISQTNGEGIGLPGSASMTAYSSSNNGLGFSRTFGSDVVYKRPSDVIFSNELLNIDSQNSSAYYALGISNEAKSLSAYHSLHTGIVGLQGEDIFVTENAGSIEIELYRNNGAESYLNFEVVSEDGAAVEFIDYEFTDTQVSWQDGDSDNKSVTVNILNNPQSNGDRSFALKLTPQSQFASVWSIHGVIYIHISEDSNDLIFADGFDGL